MVKSYKASRKALPFVMPQAPIEGQPDKWFRGVIQTNHDLLTVLERRRDSYKGLSAKKAFSEAGHAVLVDVAITLSSAKNAQAL
jgi:hypothetical protein